MRIINNTFAPIFGYAEPGAVVLPENAIMGAMTTGAEPDYFRYFGKF